MNNIIWKHVEIGGRRVKMPFAICQKCSKEYHNGNVFTSKYCTECSLEVKKETTRERVRRYRIKIKKEEK